MERDGAEQNQDAFGDEFAFVQKPLHDHPDALPWRREPAADEWIEQGKISVAGSSFADARERAGAKHKGWSITMSFDRSRRGPDPENVWTGSAWTGGAEPHADETACLGTSVRGQSRHEAAGPGLAERLLRRRSPAFGMGQGIHMSEPCPPDGNPSERRIDLRPLLSHPDATEMLLLARGQLNRAFRQHGLCPPDPMPAGGRHGLDPAELDDAELDDPAARGVERARAEFREPFAAWAAGMPLDLAGPVLKILRRTHAALSRQASSGQPGGDAARIAVLIAHDFLLDHANGD